VSDKFVVNKTKAATVRRCPFCNKYVKDQLGRDINFIVHLGKPLDGHTDKKAWADYLTIVNIA
jgi:methyl coenzyme M reductase gamma subunit